MAKTFTDKPLHRFDQVKTDNITTNLDKYLDEINGGLDANNLPVDSVGKTNLRNPVTTSSSGGDVDKFSIEMPTQSYHEAVRDYNSANTPGAVDIYDPIFEVDLDTDFYGAGFNPLQELDQYFVDFPLQFEAKEGMLLGCAVLDWEHGNQVYDVSQGPRGRGNDWWTEIQVYVNNVVVARSGRIMPKRHTTQLPFAVACGSQPITIDIRVKINNWYVSGGPGAAGTWIATPFKVFSARTWCRNQYR